jgi:hypothetical protein
MAQNKRLYPNIFKKEIFICAHSRFHYKSQFFKQEYYLIKGAVSLFTNEYSKACNPAVFTELGAA